MKEKKHCSIPYIHKNKMNTHIKKSGFTLIEVIAVIAIIGILASVMLPKLNNYINEAKKLKVVDQSRKVVMAVESYNLKYTTPINRSTIVDSVIGNEGIKKYFDGVSLDNLNISSTTVNNCYDIVDGAEFDFIEGSEILDPLSICLIINNSINEKNNNKS